MRNITISIDPEMLVKVKQHAASHGMSVNALIKKLLKQEIGEEDLGWADRFLERGRRLGLSSGDGKMLTREEIYDR